MKLYWKDIELSPGTVVRVEEQNNEVYNEQGKRAIVTWEILDIRHREANQEYLEPSSGKSFPLQKVMKHRRLYKRMQEGRIIHIPPCTEYLLVREYHDGEEARLRCYSVDMLGLVTKAEVVG
jgi:hypothetical protein